MRYGIYTVYDNKAMSIIGMLMTHAHEAAAIRAFTDIVNDERSMLARHPEDFDFIRLGWLEDTTITPDFAVVISAQAYLATRKPELVKES